MKNKILIVVDMQEDFITGTLGSAQAREVLPKVAEKVKNFEGEIIFTMDTHGEDYLDTQEGKNLPVAHCLENTPGWELASPLNTLCREREAQRYKKGTFGSLALAQELKKREERLAGLPICVDASCCAGVTPQKHEAALETMRSCQINVN